MDATLPTASAATTSGPSSASWNAPWNAPVRVAAVPYGRGVFATTDLPAVHFVAEVGGRVIRDRGYSSDTCIDLGGPYSLEPAEPFSRLNHSCEPNCRIVLIDRPRSRIPRVILDTLRPIRRGEQLTIDYAWSADGAVPCLCGSPRCRGWIVAADQRDRLGR